MNTEQAYAKGNKIIYDHSEKIDDRISDAWLGHASDKLDREYFRDGATPKSILGVAKSCVLAWDDYADIDEFSI